MSLVALRVCAWVWVLCLSAATGLIAPNIEIYESDHNYSNKNIAHTHIHISKKQLVRCWWEIRFSASIRIGVKWISGLFAYIIKRHRSSNGLRDEENPRNASSVRGAGCRISIYMGIDFVKERINYIYEKSCRRGLQKKGFFGHWGRDCCFKDGFAVALCCVVALLNGGLRRMLIFADQNILPNPLETCLIA